MFLYCVGCSSYVSPDTSSEQPTQYRNIAHCRHFHMYVYITLQRECDVFDLEWNVFRIRALHLELSTAVPDAMVAFRDAYGPKI